MADEELDGDFAGPGLRMNKKLSLFVIDGSEKMFAGGNEGCAFRKALTCTYHQILKVCSSGSLSHMVGVVILNTKITETRIGQDNVFEWIELTILGSEEALELKEMLDSDDIHSTFEEKFGGHTECNIPRAFWGCIKLLSISASSKRHHHITYFTNELDPFNGNADNQRRLERIIRDFTRTSYRDKNGLRKVVKTPGEFLLVLLNDDYSTSDRLFWEKITDNITNYKATDLDVEAYKKTFSERSFSNLKLEIGPGTEMAVGVYIMVQRAVPPAKRYLDAETEQELVRVTSYVPKATEKSADEEDDEFVEKDEDSNQLTQKFQEKNLSELKKAVFIGGESICTDPDDLKQLAHFDAKGIVLLGFKPLKDIDLTMLIQPSQFLYPDETSIHGSVKLYRALLQKCIERNVAMICRFCSRSNQKVRLVALVPQCKLPTDHIPEEDIPHINLLNEYRQNGFVVVFLPYAEDIRDVSDKLQPPAEREEWYRPTKRDTHACEEFIEKLTEPFVPEKYFNPRMRSHTAMVIEAAVGEKIKIEDPIVAYHKKREPPFGQKMREIIAGQFGVGDEDPTTVEQSKATRRTADGGTPSGSAKRSRVDSSQTSVSELAKSGGLNSLTVAQLRAAIVETGCGMPSSAARKADLVQMLEKFYG